MMRVWSVMERGFAAVPLGIFTDEDQALRYAEEIKKSKRANNLIVLGDELDSEAGKVFRDGFLTSIAMGSGVCKFSGLFPFMADPRVDWVWAGPTGDVASSLIFVASFISPGHAQAQVEALRLKYLRDPWEIQRVEYRETLGQIRWERFRNP